MPDIWSETVPVMADFPVRVVVWAGEGQLTGVAGSWVGGLATAAVWAPDDFGLHSNTMGLGSDCKGKTLLINVAGARTGGGATLTLNVLVYHLSPEAPEIPFGQTALGPRSLPFDADETAQLDISLAFV